MLRQTPRGNFIYEPDGKVLSEYFWDRSRLSIIQGPVASGTSTCSCHKVWAIACEQAPDWDGVRRSRWIITRDTYKELRDTTIKTWLEWFPESDWGPMIRSEPAYHNLRRRHPSGDGTTIDCEVIFLAVPDPDVAEQILASFEITGFFRNEGQFTDKGVVDELLSRCGRYPSMKGGPGATWFGGFVDLNAPVEGHWIPYMRGDIPLPVEMGEDEKMAYERPKDWRFFLQPPGLIETRVDGKIVYQPNPAAENQKYHRQPYMEMARGKKKPWIDRRILNKVGLAIDGKSVYPTFSEDEHTSKTPLQPIEGWPIIVGMDFGRDPAAALMQCVNGNWRMLVEIIGDNESAELFAPRVKRALSTRFPGFPSEFFGDPRGADGTQATEVTAYDVFLRHGMHIIPATTDNNPEMRRSTVESVLSRRNGLIIDPSCLVAKTGFAGSYCYPQIKVRGVSGLYGEKPRKNRYSHIVEAVENALLGGGEGEALVRPSHSRPKLAPSPIVKHRVNLRRRA